MVVFDERPLVNSISVEFQNPKPPLNSHPSSSDIRDPPSTASYSDRVSLNSSSAGSVGSGGFRVVMDNPVKY